MPPQAPSGSLSKPRYPTFYACYLLKSLQTPKSNRTYIGSTPNPARRLRQHNGEITAGAWKTRNGRPWDMTMIVHGFPSRTAALQFEWAWQHPHLSVNLRGADGKATVGRSLGLAGHIKTVRFMINSLPYSTWPLHIKLFTTEAAQAWVNAAKSYPTLPQGFTSSIEIEGVDGTKVSVNVGSGRTGPIDVHDTVFTERHLAVASAVRAMRSRVECSVCKSQIEFQTADPLTLALCSTPFCYSVSHIPCLATEFLRQESSDEMIPRGGRCSSCQTWTLWGDIIKGADRRKFGAVVEESDVEEEDEEDESDMEASNHKPKRPSSGAVKRTESVKKSVAGENSLVPGKKATRIQKPTSAVEKRRRAHPAKAKAPRGAAHSMSTAAIIEAEDFSALIAEISDATEDET